MPRLTALALGTGLVLLGWSAPLTVRAEEPIEDRAIRKDALQGADKDLIEKGKYLVISGDCTACHTASGGKFLAGNYKLDTPIGAILTPNLTPDKETGMGKWSYEQFEQAFRHGIGNEGEYLYPAFPFGWFTKVSDDDTRAIWAYLQSIEPVNEQRKPNEVPFPFSVRSALITWRTAFFTAERFEPDPNASAEVNRGGYLVEGLAHCGMCHNENKMVGNTSLAGRYGGGVIDGWYAPNITPDGHQGIGAWSDEDVFKYLKTGAAPGNMPGVTAGPMRQTVEESLSKMKDEDLHAIVSYLRTIAAKKTYKVKDLQSFNKPGAPGGETYLTFCSSCHQPNGKGIDGAVPALAGNTSVQSEGPQSVLRVIYGGLPAQNGYAPMVAIGQTMTDDQVKDVTDYIRNSWGNHAPVMNSGSEVSTAREKTKTMQSGTAECTDAYMDGLKEPFDKLGIADQLKGLKQGDFALALAKIVPEVKANASGISDDNLVNGLTTAFCKVGRSDQQYEKPSWPIVLGNFANIAYSQVRHPEKQASASPNSAPASGMSAPSKN